MKIKNSHGIPGNNENPFEGDKLHREKNIKMLTKLVSTIEEPFVLAINAGWGKGKTSFINMWKHHLENNHFQCLYFNAWENDYLDDPLISFIGEMQISLLGGKKKKAKAYLDKAKQASGKLIKTAIPVAAKLATAGLLDIDALKDLNPKFSDILSDYANKTIDEKFSNFEANKNALKDFRKQLEGFALEINKVEETSGAIMFFIDELDRCRPTFAVELLERVKHFFNVPGIIFVLAIDKEQIGHSIRSMYGSGMDVDGYLRRFIDLEYKLPDSDIEAYCDYLFDYYGLRTLHGEVGLVGMVQYYSKLAYCFGLSPRVIDQCFAQFNVIFRIANMHIGNYPVFVAILVALRAAKPELYAKFVLYGDKHTAEVIKHIEGAVERRNDFSDWEINHIYAFILGIAANEKNIKKIKAEYNKEYDTAKNDEEKFLAKEKGQVITAIMEHRTAEGLFGYLTKHIEIAGDFVQ